MSRTRLLLFLSGAIVLAPSAAPARTLVVNQAHSKATDANPGTAAAPLKTINAAAQLAQPGDTVLVHAGVYRERVAPARGGEAGKPVVYMAAPGEEVHIRGSEVFRPAWRPVLGREGCCTAKLDPALFVRKNAPKGAIQTYNPFAIKHQTRPERTLGQVFVDGERLNERDTAGEVHKFPGTWWTDGRQLVVHFPPPYGPPEKRLVEITVRQRIFAPYKRGLAYIHVKGFRMAHCGNNQCAGFYVRGRKFPQMGSLGCRGGHHWLIEGNSIRHAKSTAIDAGGEGDYDADGLGQRPSRNTGNHVIRGNEITDNGGAGIIGIRTRATKIVGNLIARNNYMGAGGSETAGVKMHFCDGALIEGNLFLDNHTQGVWLDNRWAGARITRNVFVGNAGGGVFMELGTGPATIDNNVIAYSRAGQGLAGDGIYSHDSSRVTVAHNLIFFNANFGVWAHVGTDRGRQTSSGWRVVNNLIVGNHRGAISLPAESSRSGGNHSDRNLLAGGHNLLISETYGMEMDRPLFVVNTNKGRVAMSELRSRFAAALQNANVPVGERPNLNLWERTPYLTLGQWRLLTGWDTHSLVPMVLRPRLQTGELVLSFVIDDSPPRIGCRPVEGVDVDFRGQPIGAGSCLPGPFQKLTFEKRLADRKTHATRFRGDFESLRDAETNRFALWPMPKPDLVSMAYKPPETPVPRTRPAPVSRKVLPADAPGSPTSPAAVAKVPTEITLDGDLAEWGDVTPLPAPYSGLKSGSLRLAWVPVGLYGAANITDKSIAGDAVDPWRGDALEVWFDSDHSRAGKLTANCAQYIFSPSVGGPGGADLWVLPGREDAANGKLRGVWKQTGEGYAIEFFVPAESLQPLEMRPGARFGFHYAVDNDGKAVEQFYCDKDDGGHGAPSLWGTLLLAD